VLLSVAAFAETFQQPVVPLKQGARLRRCVNCSALRFVRPREKANSLVVADAISGYGGVDDHGYGMVFGAKVMQDAGS
jgi:hypothetical protein